MPPSPRELLNDLRALVTWTEEMVTASVTGRSAEAVEALRLRFAAAQERFTELYTTAREKAVAGAKCTDTAIRENPYRSLAIALGAGVLIGVLASRRNR